MPIRYICVDDEYLIPDPNWSWANNGSDQCYVKADAYQRLEQELNETKALLRYYEQTENYK